MKTTQFVFGIFAAVFFFATGVYFHSALPPAVGEVHEIREPASITNNAGPSSGKGKFDHKTTEAFKTCLDSRVKNGSVSIGKTTVEGRRWSIVSIPCQGESAKELYNAIQPYSTEEYVHYRDKRRGVVRFFGRLYPPSQCVQLISNGKGKETNDYSCSIRIDVDSEITEQLKL